MSRKPTGKTYRVVTIADAFKLIPLRCIDAFLMDLGIAMKTYRSATKLVGALARQKCEISADRAFTWTDDGRNKITIELGTRTGDGSDQLPDAK